MFSIRGLPGLRGLLHSLPFVRFICARMWGRGVCQWSDCLPRLSHTLPVSASPRQRESSPPGLPVSAPPTSLDECLFFIYLVSDFLAVRFSVSSGCVRRRSVSTYAAILVLPQDLSCFEAKNASSYKQDERHLFNSELSSYLSPGAAPGLVGGLQFEPPVSSFSTSSPTR